MSKVQSQSLKNTYDKTVRELDVGGLCNYYVNSAVSVYNDRRRRIDLVPELLHLLGRRIHTPV